MELLFLFQLWAVASVISIATSGIYVWRIRQMQRENPAITDGLSASERVLVAVTLFFGGVIICGVIYYYGLKSVFPLKAKSVRHMVWVYLALFFIALIGAIYWGKYKVKETSQSIVAEFENQRDAAAAAEIEALITGPQVRYKGTNFAINVPSAWLSMPSRDEKTDDRSSTNWSASGSISPDLTVNWSNWTNPNDAILHSEKNYLKKASEQPDVFILSHPSINGSIGETNFIEYQTVYDATHIYKASLYVRGTGNNRYEIEGAIVGSVEASPEQVKALREIILSFEISS